MTIDRLTSGAGIIDNLFSQDELVEVVKYMSKLPKNYTSDDGNSFAAISENHMLYSWFCKKIFNKIKELTPVDIRLIFGSYLDEKTPWGVHSDYYHHQSVSNPYMAFLIPLSVDNDMSQVGRTNTVIFNEEDAYTDNENSIKHWSDKLWKKNRSLKENNAVSLGSGLLNHVSVENLECLTINTIANWKLGSVIYWNEKYLHCSDDFVKNNVTSKQALVIHTYVV
jgi:hypothetical protein